MRDRREDEDDDTPRLQELIDNSTDDTVRLPSEPFVIRGLIVPKGKTCIISSPITCDTRGLLAVFEEISK